MKRTSFNLTFKSSLAICYSFCLSATAFCVCWYVCKNVQLCALAALAAQSECAQAQKVGGKYWDPAKTFGELIAQGTLSADDDNAIQEALDNLVEGATASVE